MRLSRKLKFEDVVENVNENVNVNVDEEKQFWQEFLILLYPSDLYCTTLSLPVRGRCRCWSDASIEFSKTRVLLADRVADR
jgi:hypothetical protein